MISVEKQRTTKPGTISAWLLWRARNKIVSRSIVIITRHQLDALAVCSIRLATGLSAPFLQMCFDQCIACHRHRLGRPLTAEDVMGCNRPFDDKQQAVGKTLRIGDMDVPGQLHHERAQFGLAVLDDIPAGMACLGQFHRNVAHWATAEIGTLHLFGIMKDQRA